MNIRSSRPSRGLEFMFKATSRLIPSVIPSFPLTAKSMGGRGSQPFCALSHWYLACGTARRSRRVGKDVKEFAYNEVVIIYCRAVLTSEVTYRNVFLSFRVPSFYLPFAFLFAFRFSFVRFLLPPVSEPGPVGIDLHRKGFRSHRRRHLVPFYGR